MTRGFTDEDAARRAAAKRKLRDVDELGVYERVECIHATDRAILCRFAIGAEAWVPQWAVHDDSEVYAKGHTGKLVVKAAFVPKLAERGVEADG